MAGPRWSRFCAVVTSALFLVLGVPSPAGSRSSATTATELFVFARDTVPGAPATTDLILGSDFTPGRIVVYVPPGYGLDLDQPPGSVVGSAYVPDPRGGYVRTDILVTQPDFWAQNTAFQRCFAEPHAATWTVRVWIGRTSWTMPLVVDPTPVDEAVLGSYRLLACFPSPYLPPEQGGMPRGDGSFLAWLRLENLTNPQAPGMQTWRALITPGEGINPSAPGAVEVRSLVPLPQVVKFTAKYRVAGEEMVVNGQVLALGRGRARAPVRIWWRRSTDASFRLVAGPFEASATGRFSVPIQLARKKKRLLYEVAVGGDVYQEPCTEPSLAPEGCLSQSVAPPPVSYVAVAIPKLPKKSGRR